MSSAGFGAGPGVGAYFLGVYADDAQEDHGELTPDGDLDAEWVGMDLGNGVGR